MKTHTWKTSLLVLLLSLGLVACGDKAPTEPTETTETGSTNPEYESSTEPVAAPAESPSEEDVVKEAPKGKYRIEYYEISKR